MTKASKKPEHLRRIREITGVLDPEVIEEIYCFLHEQADKEGGDIASLSDWDFENTVRVGLWCLERQGVRVSRRLDS